MVRNGAPDSRLASLCLGRWGSHRGEPGSQHRCHELDDGEHSRIRGGHGWTRQLGDWKVKGNIFDHFYVEYTYPNGAKGHASSRHTKNTTFRLGERAVGTKGIAKPFSEIEGENAYESKEPVVNPRYILWAKFIQSIRDGAPINEGKQVAEATMTAILGRMSAYTGRTIKYDWALHRSQLDLLPKKLELGPNPVEPIAVPGITPLV